MQRLARRRQRNRRIGAAIVAVAVFIGGASGLWAALHPAQPISRPGAPSLHLIFAARVSLDAPVTDIAISNDAVWAATEDRQPSSRLWMIDPGTNTTEGKPLRFGHAVHPVRVGEGAVWVDSGDGLLRLDPVTRHVVANIAAASGAFDIAVSTEAVWVTKGTEVLRIDPA